MKHRVNKKTFVLLEILIAFSLVSISILPFIHYPFKQMQKEISTLYEMELENLAQNTMIETEIRLHKKEIDPKWLFGKGNSKKILKEYEEVKINLFKGYSRKYLRTVSLKREKIKLTKNHTSTALVKIEVDVYEKKKLDAPLLSTSSKLTIQKKGMGK